MNSCQDSKIDKDADIEAWLSKRRLWQAKRKLIPIGGCPTQFEMVAFCDGLSADTWLPLTDNERKKFLDHIDKCAYCRRLFVEVSRMLKEMDENGCDELIHGEKKLLNEALERYRKMRKKEKGLLTDKTEGNE